MADNKPTIQEEHFQVYIDTKCKDHKKQTTEEYFSLMCNSGTHVICVEKEMKDIYFLSMEMPNYLSISKRQLPELQNLGTSSLILKNNDTLIICGGINIESRVATSACYEYSISTNEVTRLPDMITPRHSFVMFYQEDKIYVFGGADIYNFNTFPLKKCEYFDYATEKWTTMADLNRCQGRGSVFNYRNEFWLIGYYIFDSNGYYIERYIRSKNLWEIVDIKFNSNFRSSYSLLSPCENEILIFYEARYFNKICKLNLIDHTLIVVPEFGIRYREPIQALPIDESKMMVIYKNCYNEYGFALYDVKKGILFEHCPSPIYKYLPLIDNFTKLSQRIVTVPCSYTPCLQHVDRDYSAINLIFGSMYYPFQLEINSYTGKMETYPVRTDLLLNEFDEDSICRFNDNELFIYRIEEAMIYNLNTRSCKYLPKPLIRLFSMQLCYFNNCIYVVQGEYNSYTTPRKKSQRYNLVTGEWELTGFITFPGYVVNRLIQCQSRLYAITNNCFGKQIFILVFNEGKKCWEICKSPSLNSIIDVSSDYYSGDLILHGNYSEEDEIYWYSVSKGDLASCSPRIGKQRLLKWSFGAINLADTYIRFGTNTRYGDLEFQCLDPRKDEEITTHGLKNIDWDDFKIKFNEFANLVICKYGYDRWYVLPNHKE